METRNGPPPSTANATTSGVGGVVVLGKYKLGRLLGRGSFAKVHYAESLYDGTEVAIKIIDKAKTVSAAMEPWIIREVTAMRRLSGHPNILKIHEVMATKTKIYFVMELAKGGELSAVIRRRYAGRLPEPTARRYFHQLVSALHFCHQHGVSHRDIKPQNLLLDGAAVLKIADFGLSALPEQHREGVLLHTTCGTPAYTAPEVFSAAGYDGAKADAWSCGVILFQVLSGYLPFDDFNLANMYRKICLRRFRCPSWISKPVKDIIRQLLDPNPSTRMSIETLMGHVWFKKFSTLDKSEHYSLQFDLIRDEDCKFRTRTSMNAFDIISMSSGLDLSGLFEPTSNGKREKRFTVKASPEAIEERVEGVGGRFGYRVERVKGIAIRLVKGKTVLLVEISAVAAELAVVVVKVVGGGSGFEDLDWVNLRVGFEDI